MKNPKIIRVGDVVKVINPVFVVRVGYPRQPSDYLPEAETKYGAAFRRDLHAWCVDKALREIAYGLARKDGFGGKARTLHTVERPELAGKVFQVCSVRTAKTGVYCPSSYSRSFDYEDDYEPPTLARAQTHRLAWLGTQFDGELHIEVTNLEKT